MRRFTSRTMSALAVALVVALFPLGGSRFAATAFAFQDAGKTAPPAPSAAPKLETTPEAPKPAILGTPAAPADAAKTPAVADAQAKPGNSVATNLLAISHDVISGYLQNSLAQNPSMSADDLKKKGRDQLTTILAHVANDPSSKLTDVDVKLIEGLAQTIFQSFKLGSAGAAAAPVTTTTSTATTGTTAAPALITGKVREFLKDGLVEADVVYKKTEFNNSKFTQMPSADARKAELKKFAQMKPVGRDGGGTFLDDFNTITKQKVTAYAELSDTDEKTVDAMIVEVVDGTPAQETKLPVEPSKTPAKTEVVTEVVDTALHIVADFVPQFAPFEPLAEGAANYLIPVVERWRPLHRIRSRFGRREVVLDSGGSDYLPASQTSRSRYIIVNP